jgi:hypothetical protein
MNCADVEIPGGMGDGSLTGPELLVARLPGTVDIPRWANEDAAALDDREHFTKRKISTIPIGDEATSADTVVDEPGDGKEGVKQPPAVIPWDNFIASKFISYESESKMIDDIGDLDDQNTFYISTSD